MVPELDALNALREARDWGWDDTATAMAAAGCPVSKTTLARLATSPAPPRDRTLHQIRTFLARVEGGEPPLDAPPTRPRAPNDTPDASARPPVAPVRRRYAVGDTLPMVLTGAEFAALLEVSASTLWRRRAQLRALEVRPAVARTPRYSGPKIQRWLEGQADRAPGGERSPQPRAARTTDPLRMTQEVSRTGSRTKSATPNRD